MYHVSIINNNQYVSLIYLTFKSLSVLVTHEHGTLLSFVQLLINAWYDFLLVDLIGICFSIFHPWSISYGLSRKLNILFIFCWVIFLMYVILVHSILIERVLLVLKILLVSSSAILLFHLPQYHILVLHQPVFHQFWFAWCVNSSLIPIDPHLCCSLCFSDWPRFLACLGHLGCNHFSCIPLLK